MRIVMLHADVLGPLDREALYAFLRAWQQHWPSSFASRLGPAAIRCLGVLEPAAKNASRYLKLKRLSVAHLARTL